MTTLRVAAVDLGATSGRVMAGTVGPDVLELEELHRFANGGVQLGSSLVWDAVGIYRETLTGIRAVARSGPLHGIGIDSWAIDYGLLDRDGQLIGSPYSHRDRRTDGVMEEVLHAVSAERLYAVTGLQQLPFNTVYQLVAARDTAALQSATSLLLIPDLLGYWLTGSIGAERTNASTTQLYDVPRRTWSVELAELVGIPTSILPPLRDPGDRIGWVRPEIAAALDLDQDVPVIAVGSHDTASAVVGVPAEGAGFGYISSGTWSLVGLELAAPVLSDAAREADFTNETGVDDTVRFLKNVMGLWVLSECVRAWQQGAGGADLPTLLAAAAQAEPLRTVVDIDDASLLAPSTSAHPMPERVVALARRTDQPLPECRSELVRCILDSLALAYRRCLCTAAGLAGTELSVVHVVGGGSRNDLLCQLTADACGLPVLAGPTEAAALGNVLVQARALGADLPDLTAMRELVRRTHEVRRYEPRTGQGPGWGWEAAERRVIR